jgi:hypothetical protein
LHEVRQRPPLSGGGDVGDTWRNEESLLNLASSTWKRLDWADRKLVGQRPTSLHDYRNERGKCVALAKDGRTVEMRKP